MRHQQLILSALLMLGLGLTGLQAQENALAFNGTSQYVIAPNAQYTSQWGFYGFCLGKAQSFAKQWSSIL